MQMGGSLRTRSSHCSRRSDWTSRTARRALLAPLSIALVAAVASADAASRAFKWNELEKQGNGVAGTVLPQSPDRHFIS
jgi:hypothetical protein